MLQTFMYWKLYSERWLLNMGDSFLCNIATDSVPFGLVPENLLYKLLQY